MNTPLSYRLGRGFVNIFARWMLNLDVELLAALPEGPKIIAPNHPTTVDPFLIVTAMEERMHVLVTQMAFNVPVFGTYLRRAGHVCVDHDHGRPAFDAAQALLRAGETVTIFPEGALSPLDGGWHKPHTGVARLALLTGAPVIPVGIALQNERTHFKETRVKGDVATARWYLRGPYSITIGAPITVEGDIEDRSGVVAQSERIMAQIDRLRQISLRRMLRHLAGEAARATSEFPAVG